MRSHQRLTILFALAVLLAGCGSVTTQTNTTATATETIAPTATPSPTPLPAATQAQFTAACPKAQTLSGHIYQFGDLYVATSLTNISYPSVKLPDGTPLAPFKLPSTTDASAGLPQTPVVNPKLESIGVFVEICNAAKGVTHRVEGVSAHIESFRPFTSDLNGWQFCDGWYAEGRSTAGGCGGSVPPAEFLHASFAPSAGAGASAMATFVRKSDFDLDGNPFPALPVRLATGQSLIMTTAITAPTAPGYYKFSFSGRVDGADLPFAPLADELLLAPARRWSGDACLKTTMQAQIVAGSKDAYICPTSTT
jgi:hypothetical protein